VTEKIDATKPRDHAAGFSLAELVRPPNLVSLLRLPLAAVFPWVADHSALAVGVLAASGFTDVLDGWLARRNGDVTATGAIVDPLADKVFAITVVFTLIRRRVLPVAAVPALLAREIFETPLVIWLLVTRRNRDPAAATTRQANVPGKIATVAQFGTVAVALAAPRALPLLVGVAACTGIFAGLAYWTRELRVRNAVRPM
jgi:CDP-diacylglycerol--glycerol-3-phosphate 3-phosphatidyltransferase/cardiolipin synthase